ncbi:hypothetical protein HPB50_025483 [Hyalomma asiaticum]|uniref:Uncharacterized protein n=1 Tax=Hyalomma asiaticum TaxID=266040 RepID=A0ACB7SIW4_HYAAI|nr:hypothetical protein HPB50_025483 [Hyalomma asiaticum]
MAKAVSAPLLICGEFNAPHTQWGYGADSPKVKKLARLVDDFGLIVLNEPASHTRIGQGACRDLSIWSGADAWSNSFEDLGSDHRVLCVTVGEDDCEIDVCLKARIVDWEQFRKSREQDKKEGPIEDIGEWCRGSLADVERVTKEIEWTDWRQEPPKGDRSGAGGGDGVPEPTRVQQPDAMRFGSLCRELGNKELSLLVAWELLRTLLPLSYPSVAMRYSAESASQMCVRAVARAMEVPLLSWYLFKEVTPGAVSKAKEMADYIRKTILGEIDSATWLDGPTKQVAITKVYSMRQHVGYPKFFATPKELDKFYSAYPDVKKSFVRPWTAAMQKTVKWMTTNTSSFW